jgi:serine/threonine protein kinase/TolB-like protein/Flp pilus assembly protein TadD
MQTTRLALARGDDRESSGRLRYHRGAAMADGIGSTLSKYRILKPLSTGGMGSVYLAEDTSLRRKVAIKVLTPEWAEDAERFQRFQREARVLATLNHPNIVTIYSVEEEDGVHFLTMELVEGDTLAELIPSVGMTLDRIFEIAVPLAAALAAAHERGIVHRDLKPGNIMVSRDGRVKVLDFGLAKRENGAGADEAPRSRGGEPITRAGLMMGTVPYMSPEQLQGDAVDHRTDIFSLGVILYEMATGGRPFDGRTWSELASSILRDQPPSVTALNVFLPRHLGRIIRHCLEKEPQRRFQTALDLRNELEELQREVQSGELPVTRSDISSIAVPRPEVPPRRFSDRAVAVAASFLVAAVVLLLVWLRAGGREPAAVVEATPAQEAAAESIRIVVLPLEHLGPAEHEYFTAGITEEITSRLSAVSALQVISRTTARHYDRAEKTVQEIGRDLGVTHLLEGSVRWGSGADGESRKAGPREAGPREAGPRVRVTSQLVRVADDTQIWSASYERVIDDIFLVQSEIAAEVIRQLDVALLEPEQEALAARSTQNLEAYQTYLRGMDYASRRDPNQENLLQAERMFERATELDPGFALAYAELSEVHSQIYHLLIDRSDERLARAREAADRALEIVPGLGAGHRARGYYYYWGHGDYDAALGEFDLAARALPNDSQLLEGLAYIRRRQGRFDEAISEFKKALALDPAGSRVATELAHTYTTTRRYELADRTYDRAISLAPNEPIPYQLKALNYLLWEGAVDKARSTLEAMPGQEEFTSVMARFRQELLAGDFQAALQRIEASPLRLIGTASGIFPRTLLRGQIHRLMGDPEEAQLLTRGALVVLERLARLRPEDARVRSVLGIAYAELGRREEAVREGRRAAELVPISEDAIKGAAYSEQLAAIYAAVGEPEAACELIEELLAIPSEISVPMLRLDPRWRPLRGHPRFEALLEIPPPSPNSGI